MRVPSTDGVELEVHDLGGDGPPLLLCHATGFHGLVWRPLGGHLADRFSLWSLDFRGHGLSTPPDPARGFDWAGFADDVLAVVDALGIRGAAAVGHSKGGAALLLAEAARPGTFSQLWCYEPIVFAPGRDPGESGLAAGAAKRRDTFPSKEEAVANYASKRPLRVLHPDALTAYVEHGFAPQDDGSVVLRCRPADESQVYQMGGSHRGWEVLPDVACPTTIACGGEGATVGVALADQLAARLPHGRVEVFGELGHFGPLEDPEAVAAVVARDLAPGSGPVPPTGTGTVPAMSNVPAAGGSDRVESGGTGHPAVDAAVAALGVSPDAEHPVADAAVTALGGTPAGTERPPESPVQPVLPPGLAGLVRRFDVAVDRSFAPLRNEPRANKAMFAASALGDFSLLWHLIGTARALRSPADERQWLRLGTSLLVESVLINGIVKSFFRRERPEWEQERAHALRKPRSSSFPSGHATSGFMAATLLANGDRRRAPFWYALASVVAASRVHVRIHHPSDVLAGSLVGVGLGALARRVWPLPR